MKNRRTVLISIAFSIGGVGIGGIHIRSAWAEAPSIIILEEEYTTVDPREYSYSFSENLKKEEGLYQLSAVTYQAEVHEYAAKEFLNGKAGTEDLIMTDALVYHNLKETLLPNDRIADDKGVRYLRRSSSLEAVEGEMEKKQLETEILYEGIAVDSEIPSVGRIEIQDLETERGFFQQIPLFSYSFENYRWSEDFWFPITFSVYDAQRYYLGNKIISYDDEFPALKGCEEDLLRVIGKSPENYVIKNFEWDGEPYTDEHGVMRRNAVGKGSRLVADCHALYRGEREIPSPSYVYRSVYEGLPEERSEFNVEYKIKAAGIYRAVDKVSLDGEKTGLDRWTADFLPSFALIGKGAAIASLIIYILFLGIGRRKREEV